MAPHWDWLIVPPIHCLLGSAFRRWIRLATRCWCNISSSGPWLQEKDGGPARRCPRHPISSMAKQLMQSHKHLGASGQICENLGHGGCAIGHYVWGRASISALERQARQLHAQRNAGYASLLPDSPPYFIHLSDFVVVTPCALHDCHNAFRWSFLADVTDKDMVRYIYVAIESLKTAAICWSGSSVGGLLHR